MLVVHLYRLLEYDLCRYIRVKSQVLEDVSLTLIQRYPTKLQESMASVTGSIALTEIYQVCDLCNKVNRFGTLQQR